MGWQPQPRWDKTNDCFRAKVGGKQYSLGSDYPCALVRLAKIIGHRSTGTPEFVPGLVVAWRGDCTDWMRYISNQWAAFEARTALADLDRDSLDKFAKHLAKCPPKPGSTYALRAKKLKRKGKLSAQTRRHFLSTAIRCCRWGFERGYLDTMPDVPRLPALPDDPKDIDDETLRKVLEAFKRPEKRRAKLLFDFMLATGCRPAEARLLSWSELRLRDAQPRIVLPPERHKTGHRSGKTKTVFLNDDALAVLQEARAASSARGFVFISRTGNPYTKDGFYSICKRAGCTPYQLRHTYGQHALDRLKDLALVHKVLGHTDKSMRSVHSYARIRDRRAAEAAQSLPSPSRRVLDAHQPVSGAASKRLRHSPGNAAPKRARSAKARSA